ncbi:ribonuclease P protein component [Tahibacter sp.]|uniref:ribonuclease P protein component n=1 Tax=Tahibacter sp. TaxID=2056211 RepID=UPI002D7FEC4F|nr:ribonuclease P protein component [Tahibacter sp.]
MLKPGDFARLRQASRRVGSRYFSAEYRNTEDTAARLGLAVSRRVSKLAVQRNRLKRLVRESFRRNRALLAPIDILVISRSAAVTVPGSELLADLEQLWSRLPRAQR